MFALAVLTELSENRSLTVKRTIKKQKRTRRRRRKRRGRLGRKKETEEVLHKVVPIFPTIHYQTDSNPHVI